MGEERHTDEKRLDSTSHSFEYYSTSKIIVLLIILLPACYPISYNFFDAAVYNFFNIEPTEHAVSSVSIAISGLLAGHFMMDIFRIHRFQKKLEPDVYRNYIWSTRILRFTMYVAVSIAIILIITLTLLDILNVNYEGIIDKKLMENIISASFIEIMFSVGIMVIFDRGYTDLIFSKICFYSIDLEKMKPIEKIRYYVNGIRSYNEFFKSEFNLQIKGIEKIYSDLFLQLDGLNEEIKKIKNKFDESELALINHMSNIIGANNIIVSDVTKTKVFLKDYVPLIASILSFIGIIFQQVISIYFK